MAQLVRDVMTVGAVAMPRSATMAEAAHRMRDEDIGDVLVLDGDRVCGVVTDRDLVVRGLAFDLDADETTIGSICSDELTCVTPETDVVEAVDLMRAQALRRLPVVQDGGRPVGMVTIGDLALELDPDSVLADISAAAPNR
jgi:CBS domain-containing protein